MDKTHRIKASLIIIIFWKSVIVTYYSNSHALVSEILIRTLFSFMLQDTKKEAWGENSEISWNLPYKGLITYQDLYQWNIPNHDSNFNTNPFLFHALGYRRIITKRKANPLRSVSTNFLYINLMRSWGILT